MATRKFEKQVAKVRKRLTGLKRARAGRIAGQVSGVARAPSNAELVQALWRDLGGGYGAVRRLAMVHDQQVVLDLLIKLVG